MSLTVSQVREWNPDAMLISADGLTTTSSETRDRMYDLTIQQDDLAESWRGTAAAAAAERVIDEERIGLRVAFAVEDLATALRTAAGIARGAKDHLVSVVAGAHRAGFQVGDDGVVDAEGLIGMTALASPEDRAAAVDRLRAEAEDMTYYVRDALRQAEEAAAQAESRVTTAIIEVEDAAAAARPVKVMPTAMDEFTWKPDVPATTASVLIGSTMDATKDVLVKAASAAGDDVADGIARKLGPFGVGIGVVPAIANDIEGGMSPTKAVVTEGAGAGFGAWLGGRAATFAARGATGAVVGSFFPGIGTVGGFVVGVGVSTLAGYGVSKGGQLLWSKIEGEVAER